MKNPDGVILVVVEDINQNQIDQRHIEYSLFEKGIPVDQIVRKNLTECSEWWVPILFFIFYNCQSVTG